MELLIEEISFSFKGKDYSAQRATFAQAEMILEQLAEAGEDGLKALSVQKEFLLASGLSEDVISSLQMNHITKLFEEIIGAKKA